MNSIDERFEELFEKLEDGTILMNGQQVWRLDETPLTDKEIAYILEKAKNENWPIEFTDNGDS